MLDVLGVRLHVRESGPKEAPAIIMLHGFGSSLHTWEDWARALEKDYRVIRLDLPARDCRARTLRVITPMRGARRFCSR